ncbi:hypothetical protein COLO4_24518, partial [Corchorus olitorius]
MELERLARVSNAPSFTLKGAASNARFISYDYFSVQLQSNGDPDYLHHVVSIAVGDIKEYKISIISTSIYALKPLAPKLLQKDKLFDIGLNVVKNGALICKSAGNMRQQPNGMFNLTGGLAPWVLTVGSINSGGRLKTKIQLGNDTICL